MARTPFNAHVKTGSTYTVPVGKYAVCSALPHTVSATARTQINGQDCFIFASGNNGPMGPIVLNAGDVFSVDNAGSCSLTGFLYDLV